LLFRADGSTFVDGKARYLDEDPASPADPSRIHVRVQLEGIAVLALLDTGAAWSIVNAEVAGALGLLDREGETKTIDSRLGSVQGKLIRIPATLSPTFSE